MQEHVDDSSSFPVRFQKATARAPGSSIDKRTALGDVYLLVTCLGILEKTPIRSSSDVGHGGIAGFMVKFCFRHKVGTVCCTGGLLGAFLQQTLVCRIRVMEPRDIHNAEVINTGFVLDSK